jgi:hypothetical protein
MEGWSGVSELLANFVGVRADFAELFPQIQAHVSQCNEAESDWLAVALLRASVTSTEARFQ